MAHNTKAAVNPFLFTLLKYMLYYEVRGLMANPSDNKIAEFIYDRYSTIPLSKYSKEEGRCSFAFSKAQSLRKNILFPKDFRFSISMLDSLSREIRELGKFSNWNDFVEKYKFHPTVKSSQAMHERAGYGELPEKYLSEISGHAWSMIYKIHDMYQIHDPENRHNVIEDDETFCLRTAQTSEINEIELLASRVYPCPINGFDIKKPWHDKNPNIFYIYKDRFGIRANINLLPLKENFYNDLKNGVKYENKITHHDIHSLEEKTQVRYIYVEGLACTQKLILPIVASNFSKIISSLANTEHNDLTICAIGGSKEGDLLMKNKLFERTGWAKDPSNGEYYPFFEIKWKKLKDKLEHWGDEEPPLVKDDRLSPNNDC